MKKYFDPVLKSDVIPDPPKGNIEKTIFQGQQYMDSHIPQKTALSKLFLDQLHYISPLLWLAQFGALILLIFAAFTAQDMSYETAGNTMLLLASLTAVFAVPEFFKDISCGVLEIEMTCKNSSASVFSIRLMIIGFVNISMITLFSTILSVGWGLRFWHVILFGLVPVNVIYILNFLLFRLFRICGRLSVLSCSVLTTFFVYGVSSGITLSVQFNVTAWSIIFVLTSVILIGQCIHEILCISKRQGVVLWNY